MQHGSFFGAKNKIVVLADHLGRIDLEGFSISPVDVEVDAVFILDKNFPSMESIMVCSKRCESCTARSTLARFSLSL